MNSKHGVASPLTLLHGVASPLVHPIHPPMTVAVLAIATRILLLKSGDLEGIPPSIVDAYPKLVDLTDSITAEPKITEYLAKFAASK